MARVSIAEPLIQASLIGEALDAGPLLVFVADEDMRYAAVNARACAVLGYARDELLGLRVTDVCRYDEAPEEYEAMKQAGGLTGVAVLTRRDGSTLRFRYWARETTVAGLPYYVSAGLPE